MSKKITDDILVIWQRQLAENFYRDGCLVEREHTYINKRLPFRAVHMGKKNDEYFLDTGNKKIHVDSLMKDLDLLIIKDFQNRHDLSLKDKQATKATSRADLYVQHEKVEIVIELEVFKDKPFSNLIYIPEVCSAGRQKFLHFIHCFAPERQDKEAVLARKIGYWLKNQPRIAKYEYSSYVMPCLPKSIKYLLPHKKAAKPRAYRSYEDEVAFRQYIKGFGQRQLIPAIRKIITPQVT